MARQVAFAMMLPVLSEEQEKRVHRYGSEHCQELRIVERDGGVVVAGVLIRPFKNKKVAQTAFGINLKAWEITRPTYTRAWYRELSFEEYFAEFAKDPGVSGRQLQEVVSATVARLVQIGAAAVLVRDEANWVKAKIAREKRDRISQALVDVDTRRMREIFETLEVSVRSRLREVAAMSRADAQGRRMAAFDVKEEKRQAELACIERLKCPEFKAQVDRERVEKEKALQAANVLFHAEEREKKRRKTEQ